MSNIHSIQSVLNNHRIVAEAMAADNRLGETIDKAVRIFSDTLRNGKTIFAFGNGGSAADAQHFTAELVGRFYMERPGLRAVALTTDVSVITSLCNDFGYDEVFTRQIEALGQEGDSVLAISTSGNSPNVIKGIGTAMTKGMNVVGLTGKDGGAMAGMCDTVIIIPSDDTPRIQEGHVLVYHILCELIEREVCGKKVK
ncbi:MAG: D-sedoheptulose 7-phosphate isomerase [Candidatus Latescibacteria bacterium]|nr:D-sedoheptulose 7-phosphate isomerase [Candidatus Latescibacterota bacterium]